MHPASPAAPGGVRPVAGRAGRALAEEIALEIEGRRRTWTLGGSLLLIPAASMAALAGAVGLEVEVVWLPLCALAGLSAGPALCTASLALANVLGAPQARRVFRQRARALGLGEEEMRVAWAQASAQLDDRARTRLERGAGGMLAAEGASDER
jgi:hypothetical protein